MLMPLLGSTLYAVHHAWEENGRHISEKGGPCPSTALRFDGRSIEEPFSLLLLLQSVLNCSFAVAPLLCSQYARMTVWKGCCQQVLKQFKNAHFGLLCTSFSEAICRPNWKLGRRRRNNFNISRWILIGKVGCSSFLRSYLYVKYEEFA